MGWKGYQLTYHGASYADNTWDVYWYEKNLFGDIVAVYDRGGTKLVSYTYDAWGNFTTTYHNGTTSTSVVANNPFMYRRALALGFARKFISP